MATSKVKIDDIDGSTATQTVRFTVYGKTYTLDVNDIHATEFAADVEKWAKIAADKAAKTRTRTSAAAAPEKPEPVMLHGKQVTKEEVRTWAKEQGLKVGDFFVSPKLFEQYVAAKLAEEAKAAEQEPQVPAEPQAAEGEPDGE